MLKVSIALSLAAAIALAACESPQPAAVGPAPGAPADSAQLFARVDRNADGKIDQAEFEALQQFRFRQLDADKNGALSAAEMQGGRRGASPERFARLDANNDGMLTDQEYIGGQMAMLSRLDADQDGAISAEEFGRLSEALAGRA